MKYLISGLALSFAIVLSLAVAYCIYLGFTDSPYNFIVAASLFMTDCVAILVSVAAISAVRSE